MIASWPERAYFSLFWRRMVSGMHSRSLWGPADGRWAYTPLSLSRHQADGANILLRCFFGPLAYTKVQRVSAVGDYHLPQRSSVDHSESKSLPSQTSLRGTLVLTILLKGVRYNNNKGDKTLRFKQTDLFSLSTLYTLSI